MSGPDSKPQEAVLELSLTDHFMQAIKAALEFNTQIIEIATEVIAMDPSGHNKTAVRRVHEQFTGANKNYSKQIDEINRRIVEQYLPKMQTEESTAPIQEGNDENSTQKA